MPARSTGAPLARSIHVPASAIPATLFIWLVIVKFLFVLLGGEDEIVRNITDDAFYYFVTASNFASSGQWSFDGVTTTSGYHLLWMYVLVGLHTLIPDIDLTGLYILYSGLGMVLCAGGIYFVSRALHARFGTGAVWAVVLVFCSPVVLTFPFLGLETPFVVFFGGMATWIALRPEQSGHVSITALAVALLVGIGGSLSRSDFGLLPFVLFSGRLAGCLIERRPLREWIAPCLPSFCLLAGASLGVALVLGHVWLTTGRVIQNSAAVKQFWSQARGGHTIMPPLRILADLFTLHTPNPSRAVAMAVMALATLWGLIVTRRRAGPVWIPLAGIVAVIGYLLVYARNGAVLHWYLAAFTIPVCMMLAPASACLSARVRPALLRAIPPAAVFVILLSSVGAISTPMARHHPIHRDAGLYLRDHPEIAPVAAWNAGVVNYFSGRGLINIDGLINDEMYEHFVNGTTSDYLLKRNIRYIVDMDIMLSPRVGRGLGFGDGRLQACVTPIHTFPHTKETAFWDNAKYQLFEVDHACLREVPPPA